MPLRDHFHPPLIIERPWEGFHSTWATSIADLLNEQILPEQYVALPLVKRLRPSRSTWRRSANEAPPPVRLRSTLPRAGSRSRRCGLAWSTGPSETGARAAFSTAAGLGCGGGDPAGAAVRSAR